MRKKIQKFEVHIRKEWIMKRLFPGRPSPERYMASLYCLDHSHLPVATKLGDTPEEALINIQQFCDNHPERIERLMLAVHDPIQWIKESVDAEDL